MNVFTQNPPRVVTGLVLVALIATALYLDGMFLFGLLVIVALLGMWEFLAMFYAEKEAGPERLLGLALTAGLAALVWMRPDAGLLPFAAAFVVLALFFLFRRARDETYGFSPVALIAAGLAYVPLLLLPALFLSRQEQILLICVPVFTDTAAYFCGMRFGRHKIWPEVSPKKSVEGSLAGLAASVVVCAVLGRWLGSAGTLSFILLGLILGVMAQLGDFFESALKRSRHIKDSGSILPGHGGVLDRIDSLLFVLPTYLFCQLFGAFF